MSEFNPIPPRQAVELLRGAGIGDAERGLVDFAAAGLVKGYARLIETIDARGVRSEVRDSRIPRELWRRIAEEGGRDDVLSTGTVRVAGSGLIGGRPSVGITGVRLDEKSVVAQARLHGNLARAPQLTKRTSPPPQAVAAAQPAAVPAPKRPAKPLPVAIPDGALTVTVKQAMAALSLGRTTINKLMDLGTLVRIKAGGRTLITADSVRAVAGASASISLGSEQACAGKRP